MRKSTLYAAVGLAALCVSVTGCTSGAKTSTGAVPVVDGSATSPGSGDGTPGKEPSVTTPVTSPPSSPSGSPSGGLDVCSLLSADRASAINHVTYGAAVPKTVIAGYEICTYHNTGKHSDPIDIQALTVTVISLPGCWASVERSEGPGTNVSGVGDTAFGYEIGLEVKDGNNCVSVEGLTHAELHGDYAPDVAMAKIVLSALP